MSYPNRETLEHRGIEITIKYDEESYNPFKEHDCHFPLMYRNSDGRTDFSNEEIISFLEGYLTYNQIRRHQKRLLKMMGYDVEDYLSDYPRTEYDRTEIIQDDLFSWFVDSFSNLSKFCQEFEIKHYSGTSRGYSQGDWADVFVCWTPEFEETTGVKYKDVTEASLKNTFDLFTNWAWGDVYCYTIEETEDSYGCFYGDNWEENGLLDCARGNIDTYLENKRQKRQ